MANSNNTKKDKPCFVFRIFDLIDFPLKGKSGKRNLLVLGGFYLLLVIIFVLSPQGKTPWALIYIALLFPFVFVTVALVLTAIRSALSSLARQISGILYIVLCIIVFLTWTFLMAWLTDTLRPLGRWHNIPLWFLPVAGIIVVCGYFSHVIVWGWYRKIDSHKKLFGYLFTHFLIYVPILIVMVLERQFNMLTVDNGYSLIQTSLLLISFQYLFYCLISFGMLLRKLVLGIR